MSSEAIRCSTSLEDTVSGIDNTPSFQHPGMIGSCAQKCPVCAGWCGSKTPVCYVVSGMLLATSWWISPASLDRFAAIVYVFRKFS